MATRLLTSFFVTGRMRLVGVLLASFGIALVACLDYLTGPHLSVSIFYLLPVSLVAWYIGRGVGLVFAVTSAVVWLLADIQTDPSVAHPLIPFWNALVRLSLFVVVIQALYALRLAQKRQEELMSFVVHDLRSPLANMLTSFEMLQLQSDDLTGETGQELITLGLTSGRRMLILVNSLLDLAKLENGKLSLQPEPLLAAELVTEAVQTVSVLAKRHEVDVIVECRKTPPTICADRELTIRVLVNLLSNAIKFSPKQSAVVVEMVELAASMLTICVHDQGPGIPQEWKKRVFDKFAQVEGRRAGLSSGTGLGLTFCKMAVEAQGGRIWIEPPVKNQGTVACFTLPFA